MVEVLVERDYVAKEPNELTIAKGDIIKDVIKKQLGWLEGSLKDKKGLFPDHHVRVIEKEPSVVLRNRRDATRIRQCRVVFSYKQDHEDELNLNVGDVIEILGEEEEGWWRGLLNGKEGVFPSNFVEEITVAAAKGKGSRENLAEVSNDTATPTLPAKPTKILCEVKFAYKAQNDDELSLKEGDVVTLLSKDGQDPGWWKGDLNGTVGVFPDNFVTVLPTGEVKAARDDRRAKTFAELGSIKPTTITSQQRRSLDTQMNDKESTEIGGSKTSPPVPGKKPAIPVKKSPSGSGAAAGIFYGLKKKLVDVVDGASGSKSAPSPKTELAGDEGSDNAFDDVVRRPLLGDVRASRPKAPGRRLPTAIFKEPEPGIVNGNTDHAVVDALTNPPAPANVSSSPEVDAVDGKPKLREWEKHRAPWLEEMKLNQAKRTSTSPGPEQKLKLTPTDKAAIEPEDPKPVKPFEKESSPVDASKTTSPYTNWIKTPPNELDKSVIRNKSNVPMPSRPQTIHNINTNDTNLTKPIAPLIPKVSPLAVSKTPSPLPPKSTVDHKPIGDSNGVDHKTYLELVERVGKLEELLRKSNQAHEVAIEQLAGKLQVETEMRMELQAKFENFVAESTEIEQL